MVLPFGHDIKDQKTEEVDEEYVEDMKKNIGNHVVVPGKDSIPVHTKFIWSKRNQSSNLIGYPNKKLILDTRIY